jgi:hypothetical protein
MVENYLLLPPPPVLGGLPPIDGILPGLPLVSAMAPCLKLYTNPSIQYLPSVRKFRSVLKLLLVVLS